MNLLDKMRRSPETEFREPASSNCDRKNGGVHLAFSGILFAIAAILITYLVAFVHVPNQKFVS